MNGWFVANNVICEKKTSYLTTVLYYLVVDSSQRKECLTDFF